VKRHLPRLMTHIQEGRIQPHKVITHRMPLDEVADAYHLFSAKKDGCIKAVLVPPGATAIDPVPQPLPTTPLH
jgi:threonine dehydrogenase-like Zn-dependent dehydrogenase